jgi:uncharacterized SAM-binding protein YcdF (DUF218 family)
MIRLLATVALLVALAAAGVMELGRWLVVSDPLEPARAIVVLSGEVPYRAEEAAKIYKQGLAREVWMTFELPNSEATRLGIDYPDREFYNEQALKKLGVPGTAIRFLPKRAANTEEEELGIIRELKRVGGDRVILVTSKYHTRRVKVIWRHLSGDSPRAIVRPATDEPYNPSRWWGNSDDVKAVGHEFFGLLNAWAGFPLQPARAD